tara:strand:- start:155 stop:1018 length:864 start_codon:yes stop_codon:yes gene_type:complete
MAVPSSGEITMAGIFSEKNEDDYTAMNPEENNISLLGLSRNNQNDSDGGNINLNASSTSKPDESAPHAMSEFYGYDHDQVSNTTYSNNIADFTISTNISTTTTVAKTFTLNNPSGNLTHVFTNAGAQYGTISISMSKVGDPGSGGTSNSATGFVPEGMTATLTGGVWSASNTIYVRYRLVAHTGAANDAVTSTFTNNSVSDSVSITKTSINPAKSDMRVKTNIERIGYSDMNIPIYLFKYKEDLNTIYKGVMAQDLLKLGFDDSVSVGHDGYYMVDYNKIDVNMEKI